MELPRETGSENDTGHVSDFPQPGTNRRDRALKIERNPEMIAMHNERGVPFNHDASTDETHDVPPGSVISSDTPDDISNETDDSTMHLDDVKRFGDDRGATGDQWAAGEILRAAEERDIPADPDEEPIPPDPEDAPLIKAVHHEDDIADERGARG